MFEKNGESTPEEPPRRGPFPKKEVAGCFWRVFGVPYQDVRRSMRCELGFAPEGREFCQGLPLSMKYLLNEIPFDPRKTCWVVTIRAPWAKGTPEPFPGNAIEQPF